MMGRCMLQTVWKQLHKLRLPDFKHEAPTSLRLGSTTCTASASACSGVRVLCRRLGYRIAPSTRRRLASCTVRQQGLTPVSSASTRCAPRKWWPAPPGGGYRQSPIADLEHSWRAPVSLRHRAAICGHVCTAPPGSVMGSAPSLQRHRCSSSDSGLDSRGSSVGAGGGGRGGSKGAPAVGSPTSPTPQPPPPPPL